MKIVIETAMRLSMQVVISAALQAAQRVAHRTPLLSPKDDAHADAEPARAHSSEGVQEGSSVHGSKAPDRDWSDTRENCKLMQPSLVHFHPRSYEEVMGSGRNEQEN